MNTAVLTPVPHPALHWPEPVRKDGFLLTTSDRQLPGDNSLSDLSVTCVLAVLRPVMGRARSRLSIHDPDKASVGPLKIALK
ncbi:MAG TPA: hypothetical protein VF772_03595, partial [Terriglobales bacterium]